MVDLSEPPRRRRGSNWEQRKHFRHKVNRDASPTRHLADPFAVQKEGIALPPQPGSTIQESDLSIPFDLGDTSDICLQDILGISVGGVIIFVFSRLNSNECITQVNSFHDWFRVLHSSGYNLYSLAKSSQEKTSEIHAKHGFPLKLLADHDGHLIKALGFLTNSTETVRDGAIMLTKDAQVMGWFSGNLESTMQAIWPVTQNVQAYEGTPAQEVPNPFESFMAQQPTRGGTSRYGSSAATDGESRSELSLRSGSTRQPPNADDRSLPLRLGTTPSMLSIEKLCAESGLPVRQPTRSHSVRRESHVLDLPPVPRLDPMPTLPAAVVDESEMSRSQPKERSKSVPKSLFRRRQTLIGRLTASFRTRSVEQANPESGEEQMQHETSSDQFRAVM